MKLAIKSLVKLVTAAQTRVVHAVSHCRLWRLPAVAANSSAGLLAGPMEGSSAA